MLPAYHNLQFVILSKHDYRVEAGDVVAFKADGVKGTLVKRVAACPGDSVVIRDGRLYVNGAIPDGYADKRFEYPGILKDEILLSRGQYIVIGDNVDESVDSRYEEIGILEEENITGKVI